MLEEIKNYLDITWYDEAVNQKINGLILAGESYLNRKAGTIIPFEEDRVNNVKRDEDAFILLKEYVRYARSHALDEFEENYLHDIISLREKYQYGGLDDKKETADL